MKALEFKECNRVYAKDQPEYVNLPCYAESNGTITVCMQLENDEVDKVRKARVLYLKMLTFNNPLQPVRVTLYKPLFPTAPHARYMYAPRFETTGEVTFVVDLQKKEIAELIKTNLIWIQIRTFGTPLQPIAPSVTK